MHKSLNAFHFWNKNVFQAVFFFVKQTHYQCQCALNSLSPPAQQTECSSNRHYCRQLSGFQHLLPAVLQLKKMDHNKHKCECVCMCAQILLWKKKRYLDSGVTDLWQWTDLAQCGSYFIISLWMDGDELRDCLWTECDWSFGKCSVCYWKPL